MMGIAGADPGEHGPAGLPADVASTFDYWTADNVASAQPRDLVIDERGLGYLREANGTLSPYGHSVAAPARQLSTTPVSGAQSAPAPSGAPAPVATTIDALQPGAGDTVGGSASFTATITADTGVRSVNMFIGRVGGLPQRFSMTHVGSGVWQTNLSGLSDGGWEWYVEVRDRGPRGGARTQSDHVVFNVSTSTSNHERWTDGGAVQTAAGRILFTMPDGNYVCSGTAITDGVSGRSVILTAAHCIYDDVANVFASNALFIPSQDDGGTDGTDFDCMNDPIGCWAVDHGVVDLNWTTRTFPDNVAWDFGYYVVSDSGAHQGAAANSALDIAAGTLDAQFTAPVLADTTTALGYSYSHDPNFMYCAESLATNGPDNYWLPTCGLSGGASGGPWLQPVASGDGPVMSVNSWGYTTAPGMAGPLLHGTSASLLFEAAKSTDLASADRGFVIDPTTTTPTTTTVPPGDVTLSIVAYKEKGTKIGELTGSGTSADNVDIVRDGSVVGTTANDGSHVDLTGEKGGGSTTWQVCEAASDTCSPTVVHNW
jgi:hypothetical protein